MNIASMFFKLTEKHLQFTRKLHKNKENELQLHIEYNLNKKNKKTPKLTSRLCLRVKQIQLHLLVIAGREDKCTEVGGKCLPDTPYFLKSFRNKGFYHKTCFLRR